MVFITVQESLTEEKLSKATLAKDATESMALLVEEKALHRAERERLMEEVEARLRLESLMASEMKKEQEMVSKAPSQTQLLSSSI